MMIASIVSDIRFGIFDVLRGLGMSIVNTIYNTIDTLYEVAEKILRHTSLQSLLFDYHQIADFLLSSTT